MIRLCRKKKWVLILVVSLGLALLPLSHSMGMEMAMDMDSCMMPIHCSACSASVSLEFDSNQILIPSLNDVPVQLDSPAIGVPQKLYHPPKILFL